MKKSLAVLIMLFSLTAVYSQVIPIDSVRSQDANGVPLLLGQTVTLRGVVSMSDELGTPLVYFQDPTGGMVGYDAAFFNNTNYGDSVEVTGVVTQYNGLTELQPVNSSSVLGTGHTVTPTVLTAGNIRLNGDDNEGKLIRVNGVTAVHNTSGANVTMWTVSGSGVNYRIITGNDSCDIRIYATTNIANTAIPPFPFDVIALLSQFDSSPPYNSGYQILPRSLSDFILPQGGGPLLSQITYSNIQQAGVTITWSSSANADGKVRWAVADSNYQTVVYSDSVYNAAQTTAHTFTLSNLKQGTIYYFNVSSTNGNGTTTSPVQYFATKSTSTGAINVYFNRSVDTTLNTGEPANGNTNLQTKLLARINGAQHSIDMALYSFDDLTQIKDALINAKIRGVKIRFVYDSRTNQSLVTDLLAAGIPIMKRNYQTSDIMHNKFFVFDYRDTASSSDDWVWTGSTNVTQQQFFTDRNNVIEIQDRTLAAIYTREFEEMWGSATDEPIPTRAKFGPAKTDNVPHLLNINNQQVEVYFSPSDNTSGRIEDLIANETNYDIYFCQYAFTRFNISNKMYTKWQAGKDVKGVFDYSSQGDVNSMYHEMHGEGQYAWVPPADVWLDNQTGLLHHKYMMIDAPYANSNPVVETGSYNYSNAATFNNDENLLIVYSPRIANLYLQEFYKRYKDAGGQGVIIIGVQQISNNLPGEFKLEQNFPNPFNPKSTIKYQIPKSSLVSLKVFDILGREAAELINSKQDAGTYQVTFDASNLSSGVYFYRLTSDGVPIDTKKMVLVK